jgi:hypothetical protein
MAATRFFEASLAALVLIGGGSTIGNANTPGSSVEPTANTINSGTATHVPSLAASATAGVAAPRASGRLAKPVRSKLESGFELAIERVQTEPRCAELFAELGADGAELLATTMYYPADLKLERDLCSGALAYTVVGGAPSWLCRRFRRLSDEKAAHVLLHEALHRAGLDEFPHDPQAMTPAAIDEMVHEACGL